MRKLTPLALALALAGCQTPIIIDASAVAKIERDLDIGAKVLCGGVQVEAQVAANPSLGPSVQHFLARNSKVARDLAFAQGLCTIIGLGGALPTITPSGS